MSEEKPVKEKVYTKTKVGVKSAFKEPKFMNIYQCSEEIERDFIKAEGSDFINEDIIFRDKYFGKSK